MIQVVLHVINYGSKFFLRLRKMYGSPRLKSENSSHAFYAHHARGSTVVLYTVNYPHCVRMIAFG